MRLILASLVVWTHTVNIAVGNNAVDRLWGGPLRPPLAMVLGMFFCLSGFLVAGSLERCRTMVSFLGLRIIRLVPALAVDTAIAALILGPTFTSLPLAEYFAHPEFRAYFLNIVGEIHFLLPGVFEYNLQKTVNGQLWTLPYELKCYAVLTLFGIIGFVRYRWLLLLTVIVAIVLLTGYELYEAKSLVRFTLYGRALVLCFLLGNLGYMFRDKIPLSRPLFGLACVAAYGLMMLPGGDYVALLAIAYVTFYLGLLTPPRMKIVSSGDYSYGIFLYGYPIQQAVFQLVGPGFWKNLLLPYPIIVALAVFSWFMVEKPALRLRTKLFALEVWVQRRALAIPFGHWMVQPPVGPWLRRPPARENL
ncbi:acyltransferase family protein [Sphingomonas sp. R86520]|uniref:acyltransferase family protein n=1 Tax=Sphingomonas sp. R86520 TaxID=3093859 RepID=UPI0036D2D00D